MTRASRPDALINDTKSLGAMAVLATLESGWNHSLSWLIILSSRMTWTCEIQHKNGIDK